MKELLAVVDMQNDFITGALGSESAREIVPKVCEAIVGWQGDIILTRDTHHEDYFETNEGKFITIPHCLRNSSGWKIQDDVQKAYDFRKSKRTDQFFAVVDKPTFGSMFLAEIAKEIGYERIVIAGVSTDICVIANAMLLRTFMPEIEIMVDESCCAGTSSQSHKSALDAMSRCNIKIIGG